VGKYGTNLEGFGGFEGGVNADKGAPLVSTSSDGETALLFGPAALREIQAGVANGDFAIPPDAAGDTITEENPLPYWTFTDTSSAGAITCAIVGDAGAGSGNVLRFTVASGTLTGKSATLSRFVPVASSASRSFAFYAEATFDSGTASTQSEVQMTGQFYKADQTTTTGSPITSDNYAFNFFALGPTGITAPDVYAVAPDLTTMTAPADAAYIKLTITVSTVATQSAVRTIDLTEVRLAHGLPELLLTDKDDPSTNPPALITHQVGVLSLVSGTQDTIYVGPITGAVASSLISLTSGGDIDLSPDAASAVNVDGNLSVTGSIGLAGSLYGASDRTGIRIVRGGTNSRLWIHSSPAADVAASTATTVSGVLVTKPTAGQPSTNINGTATTDAFADALRNGGLAVDTTNNRGYFYSNGWKYAALTTPSDSRLKEEITDITGALDTLRQLMPVAFKWKRPEAHGRSDAVADDGTRLGFIADQVATTDLKHWVETLGVDEREADLVDTTEVLAVNIPQNEMEALVVQALLDIDARLKALESR
jgi:hypothetical protein